MEHVKPRDERERASLAYNNNNNNERTNIFYFNSYKPKIGPTNLKHTQQNAINAAPYKLPWFIQYIHPFSPLHTTHSFFKGSIFSQPSGSPSHMLSIPFAPGDGYDRFMPKSSNSVAGRPTRDGSAFGNPESRSFFS